VKQNPLLPANRLGALPLPEKKKKNPTTPKKKNQKRRKKKNKLVKYLCQKLTP